MVTAAEAAVQGQDGGAAAKASRPPPMAGDLDDGSRIGPPCRGPLRVGDFRASGRPKLFDQFPIALPPLEPAPTSGGRRSKRYRKRDHVRQLVEGASNALNWRAKTDDHFGPDTRVQRNVLA